MHSSSHFLPHQGWLLSLLLVLCFFAAAPDAVAQYGTLIRQDYRTDGFRSNIAAQDLACADSLHCIVIGGNNEKESSGSGVPFAARYTHDGGASWHTWYDTMPFPQSSYLRAIAYPTPSLAIMVGDAGTIYRTTDGGVHWKRVPSGTSAAFGTVSMADSLHGIVSNGQLILRTSDGGASWQEDSLPGLPDSLSPHGRRYVTTTLQHISCLRFTTPATFSGTMLSTSLDGGAHWHHTPAPFMQKLTFLDPQYGWGIGADYRRFGSPPGKNDILYIGRTTDSGRTWETTFVDSSLAVQLLFDIAFADRLNGLAGGYNALYRTYDGGATWINLFNIWGLKSSDWHLDVAEFAYGVDHLDYPTRGKGWIYNAMLGTLLYTEDEQFGAVGRQEESGRSLRVSPSPARGSECSLALRLPKRCRGRLSVVDVQGREVVVVAEGEMGGGERSYRIDLRGIPAGRYFARLSTAEWIDTFSFLRE